LSYPRCSVISASRAVSSTLLVNWLSSPVGPTSSTPCSFAWASSARPAAVDPARPNPLSQYSSTGARPIRLYVSLRIIRDASTATARRCHLSLLGDRSTNS
jgi:hypothetical protein